jgi:hypothetical protein
MSINGHSRKKRKVRTWVVMLWVKRFAWRLTALWCWINILAWLLGLQGFIRTVESFVSMTSLNVLSNSGFAPVNQSSLNVIFKVIWILTITSFSWLQMIGLIIYIAFGPLTLLLWFGKFGKQIRNQMRDAEEKTHREKVAQNRPLTSYFLITMSAAWFLLFGNSSQRPTLAMAIVLTGLLFSTRVYKAFEFTTLIEPSRSHLINVWRA